MGWFDERFEEDESRFKFDCVVCGKHMWFPKSKYGKYKTCSAACNSKMREAVKSARAKPCAGCGKEFTPRPAQLRNGGGLFCSQKCNVHAALP